MKTGKTCGSKHVIYVVIIAFRCEKNKKYKVNYF